MKAVAHPLRISAVGDQAGFLQCRHMSRHGRLADPKPVHEFAQTEFIGLLEQEQSRPARLMREGGEKSVSMYHARLSRLAHMPTMTWIKRQNRNRFRRVKYSLNLHPDKRRKQSIHFQDRTISEVTPAEGIPHSHSIVPGGLEVMS
jgi:hypothetical protein